MNLSDSNLDLADKLSMCSDRAQVQALFERHCRKSGFDSFLLGLHMPDVKGILTMDGSSSGWLEHYTTQNYVQVDPVVKHCVTHSTPLRWCDIQWSRGSAARAERRVMQEADEFGLVSGISIPIHGPGTESGILSFCCAADPELYGPSAIPELHFATQSLYQCLRRLTHQEDDTDHSRALLTAREKECLKWTANGKTAWEIAKILSIAESTVTFHLKNTIRKMEVRNRSQAVAKGISESMITLF